MFKELQAFHQAVPGSTPRNQRIRTQATLTSMVALHLDFVAKPNCGQELSGELNMAMEDAQLANEGLEASVLLVCEREARLVTLLTFWDRSRFFADRESRVVWMQKLVSPFADGAVRAHTSLPRFMPLEASKPPASKPLELSSSHFIEVAAG